MPGFQHVPLQGGKIHHFLGVFHWHPDSKGAVPFFFVVEAF